MSTGPVPAKPTSSRAGLIVWLLAALLDGGSQVALRHELEPGEFGTMNTVLGLVAVLVAPVLALEFLFSHHVLPGETERRWQAARGAALEFAVLAWGAAALALLLIFLPQLAIPRPSLYVFAAFVTIATLLAIFGRAICATENRMRHWFVFMLVAGIVRLLASVGLPYLAPWAQSGLAAVVAAGIVTAIPAMIGRAGGPTRSEAWAMMREESFARPFLATASVMVALALFTNADRIAAQRHFGVAHEEVFHYVDWQRFDDYQAAGMMARAILWGVLPLLLVVYAKRIRLPRTSKASLHFFWFYLFVLFAADFIFGSFAPFLSLVFTGDTIGAARFIPGFAGAVPLLGLVQGIGIFILASRRYAECFVLGACSAGYALTLFLFGRQPEEMTTFMSGGALISLMIVLIFGVIRYARSHR
jgi:hypothetical protein